MQYVRHSSSPCLGGLGHPLYIRRELFSRILDNVANGLTITQAMQQTTQAPSGSVWTSKSVPHNLHLSSI